ncbi:serine/threonine protein kinase [Streptomyces sp. Root66D1]|nr:serine/threonine protein kinase [Streptomyces sp. Root1304]KRA81141.1 serine/threonine protein kinase [Streptomyces sp. Root66D1]
MIDGRFELVARLGGGGMGTVWRARDLVLHREVALKEVRPPDPALAEYDPEGARELRIRVLREARALARVAHPRVVTIHHIVDGGEGTYPWLVMELVTGGSLQERLDRDPLGVVEAAVLGRGILDGLRAAHAVGIQHRDIKPANILLTPDGLPVLTDFGIAALHGATALTAAGSIIGTPEFMAPERVGGEEGGPAADLWSLAMTLYVAVEGHHPMRRANTLATLAAVLGEDVPAPRRAGALTPVLTRVLVRDPAARPDGESFDRMLAEVAASGPVGIPTPPVSPPHVHLHPGPQVETSGEEGPPPAGPFGPPPPTGAARPSASPKRRGAVFAGAGALVVALSGVLVWNLLPGGDPDGDGRDRTAGKSGSQEPSSPASSTGASTTPSGGAGPLTVGVKSDQPGLGWKKPDGTYAGLDVDVATYLARALGHDPAAITWKEVRSSTREAALAGGDVDLVVATYTINEVRKQKVDFVGPYLVAHQDVLLRADDASVKTRTDLNGKKVCAATGSTPVLLIRTNLAPRAEVVTYDSYRRCISELASGGVDAVTTDDALLAGYAAQEEFKGRFRLAGFPVTEERYGIGLPKGSPLRARLTTALKRMIDDGSWREAVEKNLPLVRTDPPPVPE